MSDLISRQDAIDAWDKLSKRGRTEFDQVLMTLPSATSQSLTKPNKSCEDDLISRDDAVALVIKAIHGTDNKEIKEYLFDGLRKQMWSLPSAEAVQTDGDLISRQGVVNEIDGWIQCCTENDEEAGIKSVLSLLKEHIRRIKSVPSAPDSRQRGEWIAEIGYDGEVIYYECPYCGGAFTLIDGTPEDNNYNFCPNCGADMRGEKE